MYGYAIRPQSIPKSYYAFLRDSGPISESILSINRQLLNSPCDNLPENALVDAVLAVKGHTMEALSIAKSLPSCPPIIPCAVLHPKEAFCEMQVLRSMLNVYLRVLPVHISLNFVPAIAFKTRQFLINPAKLVQKLLFSAVRSSTFLAVYCGIFMRLACGIRNLISLRVIERDSKYYYWIVGLFSSVAILLEDKRRRPELAM